MNPDLLAELRRLFMPSAPADVTATPAPPRQMTIGPRTGTRMPLPEPGMLAAIQRSAQPSPDTPGGMLNEMFNPVRAGAQARELTGRAAGAMRRGEAGRAAGLGALAAMAVPGVPGPDDAARMIDVDGVLRPRFNAQGSLIHPSDEGIRNFWRWFGDSKTVDEAGRPQVLYHGTASNFDEFDITRQGQTYGIGGGAFISSDPRVASNVSIDASGNSYPSIMPLYTRMTQPFPVDGSMFDDAAMAFDMAPEDIVEAATRKRRDGVVVTSPEDNLFVAFNPLQLKSATGNSGAFSRTDPRITASLLAALGLGGASSRENRP